MKKRIAIIFFLLFFTWFWLYTKWYFWEPHGFEKGSWAYTSKVPKDIKEFEAIKPVSAVKYDYQTADGLKNEVISQEYLSNESRIKLKRYFKKIGLDCNPKYKSASCSGHYKKMRMYVVIKPIEDNKTEVYVGFTIYQ